MQSKNVSHKIKLKSKKRKYQIITNKFNKNVRKIINFFKIESHLKFKIEIESLLQLNLIKKKTKKNKICLVIHHKSIFLPFLFC